MLLFIALEVFVFGSLCAWFLAPNTASRYLVVCVVLAIAAVGYIVVKETESALGKARSSFVFDPSEW